MPRISFLKGFLTIRKNDLPIFKDTRLYRSMAYETKAGEKDPIEYDLISNNIHILFSDLPLQNYDDVIESDLIAFFNKISPGTLNLDLIHWLAIEDYIFTNYFTNSLNELVSQTLSEAPLKTLVAHPELEITS